MAPHRLVIALGSAANAALSRRVVDYDGNGVAAARVLLWQPDVLARLSLVTAADGGFRVFPLPPGPCCLTVEHAAQRLDLEPVAVAPLTEHDVGVLRFVAPAVVTGARR